MRELPSRYNPDTAARLWDKLPRTVKDVMNCQYAIRNPELTDFQRGEIRQTHRNLMEKLQEDPQAMQTYLNYQEIATEEFGPMPPIPLKGVIYEK